MRSANDRFKKLFSLILLFLFGVSRDAHADVGLPTIFLTWPAVIIALIPVTLIEVYVCSHFLKIHIKKTILGITFANLITTFLGFPFAWAANLAVMSLLAVIDSLVKGNLMKNLPDVVFPVIAYSWVFSSSKWAMFLAGFTNLFVAFWVSYRVELKFLKWFFKSDHIDKLSLEAAVWKGNVVTYLMLFGVFLIYFNYIFSSNKGYGWPFFKL